MTLYDKAIKVAINEMELQINLEGCKKIWTKWVVFQKDSRFIQAKDKQKLKHVK